MTEMRNGEYEVIDVSRRTEHGRVFPEEGFYKINMDAGVIEGMGGVGVVCRDSSGSIMWGLTAEDGASIDVCDAEATAVLTGVKEAIDGL